VGLIGESAVTKDRLKQIFNKGKSCRVVAYQNLKNPIEKNPATISIDGDSLKIGGLLPVNLLGCYCNYDFDNHKNHIVTLIPSPRSSEYFKVLIHELDS
jgi:hypothetical protein